MRIFLFSILLSLFGINSTMACNNSTISIANQTTNPDGSITYTLDVLIELGGFDAAHYGFALKFNSPTGTPSVIIGGAFPTTSTLATGDLISGSIVGTLQALTGGDINSIASDSDWNEYLGATNVISFESSELFGAASDDYSFQMEVTVMGCAESITFDANVNSGSAACEQDVSTGQSCLTCDITALSATPSACNPADNTYTADVTVTYTNAPGSGTLDVNGQSFAITASPQTVTLTGLTSDGNPVNVTAVFSDDAGCTLTSNSLYTAPAACNCAITNLAATPSACNPVDNTYSVDVTITYSNDPGSGTLDVNGQSFAITASPQTVTLSGLTSDGNPVNVTAVFSDDAGCTLTSNSLYTAPDPCNCAITNLSATPSACNPADNTYSVDVIVTYSNDPGSGTLDVNGETFAITASPQTVSLTGLTANGNPVDVTAAFSDDGGCTLTTNSLYTAPDACTPGCNANPGTISQ